MRDLLGYGAYVQCLREWFKRDLSFFVGRYGVVGTVFTLG